MSADFTPEKEDYKILTPFKMQVLTNFPYIEADFDALTNYQLLCKIVEYLNNVIHNENEVTEQVNSLYNAYVSLQNYVNNYFDNLDIQEEINNKIDELIRNGTFDLILDGYLQPYFSNISNTIADIQEEIDKQTIKIEKTLSGTPIPVTSVEAMTDTTRLYVNTTNGYWYYYDGDSWEQGGLYQASVDQDKVGFMWDTFDKTYDYNLYNTNSPDIIEHAAIGSQGAITINDTYVTVVSEKIPVNLTYIVFKYMKPTSVGFYQADDTFIERISSVDVPVDTALPTERTVSDVDIQADYIRICYNPTNTTWDYSRALCYETDDNTDLSRAYVPYNNIIMKQEHLPIILDSDSFKFEPNFYPAGIKQCAWRGIQYAIDPSTGFMEVYAPENSYPGFRKAGEEKMDFLWLAAVRYTTDNEFYIMHDATTGRTCTTDITVASSTSEQMDAVRLRQAGYITWSDNDLKIPKLEEAIKLCYRYNMNVGIRLGALPSNTLSEQNREIWDKFINLCRRYHLDNAIYSGSIAQCIVVNSYEPNWFVQATGSLSNTEQDNLDLIDEIYSKGFNRKAVILYKTNLTSQVMEYAESKNIYVFGVSDEPIIDDTTLSQYKELCVDAIITHTKIDLTE